MRATWISTLLLAGCGVDQLPPEAPGTARGACTSLEGLAFRSDPQTDCGLAPPGAPTTTCQRSLAFEVHEPTSSELRWQDSLADVGRFEYVACEGTTMSTLDGSNGAAVVGSFDEATMVIVWNDVRYTIAN